MIDLRKLEKRYLVVSLTLFFLMILVDYRLIFMYLAIIIIISIFFPPIFIVTFYSFKILRNLTDYYIDQIIIPEYEEYKKKSESGELDDIIQIVWRL